MAAIRANPLATLASDEAQTIRDTCGPSSPESFASYDRATRSWRTSQLTFLSGLETFSETWPTSGMMRNGVCSRPPKSARPTEGSASSWLPTPTASEEKDFARGRILAALGLREEFGDGGRVARRICANCALLHSMEDQVGLNPLLRGVDARLPDWSHRIKAIGNSVSPVVAEVVGQRLLAIASALEPHNL